MKNWNSFVSILFLNENLISCMWGADKHCIAYTKNKNEWVSNYLVLKQIKQTQIFIIWHYNDVIMGAIASQITSLTIVYSTVYSGSDQRKHLSFASLPFVRGFHRRPVNSPYKWPVTRKMLPFDDVIIKYGFHATYNGLVWTCSTLSQSFCR